MGDKLKSVYSGQLILDLLNAPQKSVHTESARHAHKSIIAQYGSIEPNTHYCHYYKDKWIKASEYKKKAPLETMKKITHAHVFGLEKLKAPCKMVPRKGKPMPKTNYKSAPNLKHFGLYNGDYMKDSPYTKEQISKFNTYTFSPLDYNKLFNQEVHATVDKVKEKYPDGIPPNVIKAIAYYRKAVYNYYVEYCRAMWVAPSIMVVGPANYKGKPAKADAIRRNASEKLKEAEKRLKLEIHRAQVKKEVNATKKAYDVKPGDQVILHWTNSGKKYKGYAIVEKVNANTLIGKLNGAVKDYTLGKEITVPMIGTPGNRWEHAENNKPNPTTRKEMIDKYHEGNKGLFKVGDKVKHLIYGEGVITKVNKATMIMQVPKQYDRDSGIRKVPVTNDERIIKKI